MSITLAPYYINFLVFQKKYTALSERGRFDIRVVKSEEKLKHILDISIFSLTVDPECTGLPVVLCQLPGLAVSRNEDPMLPPGEGALLCGLPGGTPLSGGPDWGGYTPGILPSRPI